MQLCFKKKKDKHILLWKPRGIPLFPVALQRAVPSVLHSLCSLFNQWQRKDKDKKKSMSTRGEMRERSDDITGGLMCVRARRLRQL